jgi:hypothetical protein
MVEHMTSSLWHPLGTVPGKDLLDAKLQLHWAAQIVASFGDALIEQRSDDSQANLGWNEQLQALCGHASPEGWSLGLRLADITILFLDNKKFPTSEFGLYGKTLQQGFEWLTSTYIQHVEIAPQQKFTLRDYDMPDHPVGQQAAFSFGDSQAFQEFAHWYANAHRTLHAISGTWKEASPIRCWPHYFDMATLVSLKINRETESTGLVGCGMSPGDGTYAEPYFYVTIWPYPAKEKLSALGVGYWRTEDWTGAILTASDLIEGGQNKTQQSRVRQFFQEGTQVAFSALGPHPS